MIKPTPTENRLGLRNGDYNNLAQAWDSAAGTVLTVSANTRIIVVKVQLVRVLL